MSWLKNIIPPKIKKIVGRVKKSIPEGLWHKCATCQTVLYKTDLEKNMEVCSNYSFHNRIYARHRIKILLDTPNQIEHRQKIKPTSPNNPHQLKKPQRHNAALRARGPHIPIY